MHLGWGLGELCLFFVENAQLDGPPAYLPQGALGPECTGLPQLIVPLGGICKPFVKHGHYLKSNHMSIE